MTLLKPLFKVVFFFLQISLLTAQSTDSTGYKNGDIVFQVTGGRQGMAIQQATHSKWTHCGILLKEDSVWYVYEAIQPVSKCKLSDWKQRGEQETFVVKHHPNLDSISSDSICVRMQAYLRPHLGKTYDIYFNWSDKEWYCSELVWKTYKYALGIELCSLHAIKEYDLSHPLVKAILKERYGNTIPLEEKVVSPDDIFKANCLTNIRS